MSTNEKDRLAVGDKVVVIGGDYRVPILGRSGTVERLTPTGIAVLDNGDRLNPRPVTFSSDKESVWEVRGQSGGTWLRTTRYYRADGESAKVARRNTEIRRSAVAITKAFEEAKSCGFEAAEAARVLITACENHLAVLKADET